MVSAPVKLSELLTPHEQDIVRFLAAGRELKEMSEDLHLTYDTIKTYLFRMRRKSGCRNKVELAVRWVKEQGL